MTPEEWTQNRDDRWAPRFLVDLERDHRRHGVAEPAPPERVESALDVLANVIHSLYNNTCRDCGVEVEYADSEDTWVDVKNLVHEVRKHIVRGLEQRKRQEEALAAERARAAARKAQPLSVEERLAAVERRIEDLCDQVCQLVDTLVEHKAIPDTRS